MASVGIDARFYGVNAGIGRYLRNLILELGKKDHDSDYYIFLLSKDLDEFKKTKPPTNFHPVEANFTWYGFEEQIKFPKVLKKYKLDLVHFPNFNVPVLYKGKFVVTIHDLTHLDFKMVRASTRNAVYYEFKHNVHKRVLNYAIKKSSKIITVSDFVKKELIKRYGRYGIDPSKIEVTPEDVEESFLKKARSLSSKEINITLSKFKLRAPFIYYIGSAHPHKNIEGLIKSFSGLRKNYQYLTLVLAGEDDYFWKRIKKETSNADIKFLGLITDEESIALFKSAICFVQPSLSEGFGIPLLEAMSCGCPVVSSNAGSLMEVGGDAALYFDPHDLTDIADKISQVLNNQGIRERLRKLGLVRYKQFSFAKMAALTLKVYNNAI